MSSRCDSKAPAPLRANHKVPLVGAVGGGVNWPRSGSDTQQPSPMRLYVSRTQPQLHTASLSTPVAMVQPMKRAIVGVNCLPPPAHKLPAGLPLKRPLSLANAEVEDSRPPTPKQLRRCRPASPAIATNPLCRRRSRDVEPSTTAPVAELPDRHQSAVANVAFPMLTPTPLFQQTVAAAAKRDAQTSPRQHPVAGASVTTPTASGGSVSLTNWVRSARCRLARLRRSFSTPRVDFAVAKSATASASTLSGSDTPTPKRLFGGRKRHASLQRLVQRLAASPSDKKTCSPTVNATAAAAACVGTASPTAVSGRVLKLLPDGSRMVRLKRPRGGKFGFFVSRQKDGVHLSRFNDPGTQRRYRSVIGVGDQILEIEGMSTTAMPLDELHRFISDKRALLIRVRSCYPW